MDRAIKVLCFYPVGFGKTVTIKEEEPTGKSKIARRFSGLKADSVLF